MKRLVFLAGGLIGLFLFTSRVFAHDGDIGSETTPIDIDTMSIEEDIGQHEDAEPWKGWANIYVKNICSQDWGDFHFHIYNLFGANTYFSEVYQPELYIRTAPLTWVLQDDLDAQWNADHTRLDLTYYGNPIYQDDWAKFRIYTDNTTNHCSIFIIAGCPTPVPEPATIALLGLGALVLLRKRK
jgi:hypothetical protein